GETAQALLHVEFQPEETKKEPINEALRPMALQDTLSIDGESLECLLKNGLGSRCGSIYQKWMAQRKADERKFEVDEKMESSRKQKDVDDIMKRLRTLMPFALVKVLADFEEGLRDAVLGNRLRSLGNINPESAYRE
ncbi:14701_t:CDS:2, partial [Acaulospora colombiana]